MLTIDYDLNNIINAINSKIPSVVLLNLIPPTLRDLTTILNEVPNLSYDESKRIMQECPNLKTLFSLLSDNFDKVITSDNEDVFLSEQLMALIKYYSYKEEANDEYDEELICRKSRKIELELKIYQNFFRKQERNSTSNQTIREMQNRLVKAAKFGDEHAKYLLIEVNRRIIIANVNKCIGHYNGDREDLEGNGVIGLLTALEKYDIDSGNRFLTFATHYIKGAILNSLSEYNKISHDHHVQSKIMRVRRIINYLSANNIIPTVERIMEKTGYERDTITSLLFLIEVSNISISLNEQPRVLTGETTTCFEEIISNSSKSYYDLMVDEELKSTILAALTNSGLTNDELYVLTEYFKINLSSPEEDDALNNKETSENANFEIIGRKLGGKKQTAWAIYKRGLKKIKFGPFGKILATYSKEDELNIRLIYISENLTKKLYSPVFPDLYSFFPEYTTIEVESAIQELDKETKTTLASILEMAENGDVKKGARTKFMGLVNSIYIILFKLYQKREFTATPKVRQRLYEKNT